MEHRRYPWLLGAIALSAGCAQVPLDRAGSSEAGAKVAPVYRVQQPAGTAAGQYAVGRIDLAEGRVDAAIKRFQQALQLDRGFVEAHNGLGVAYGQQGRFAEAAKAFEAALALEPNAPHVLNNLGFAQMKAGQLDEAWGSLKRSLALDARNERTRENLELLASVRTAALAQAAPAAATPVVAAPVAAAPAAAAPAPSAPIAASKPVAAPISESRPVTAPIVASVPVAPVVAAAPKAPAAPAVSPAPMAGPLPVAAVIKPVTVPSAAPARPAYEVIVARSSDSSLVQVAPNVYELRASAASTPATAPAPEASKAMTEHVPAAVAAAPQPAPPVAPLAVAQPVPVAPAAAAPAPLLPKPFVVPAALAVPMTVAAPQEGFARPMPAAKRPATTISVAALDGIEVSNGVGIRHLAGRTARTLSRLGVTVARVSDYRLFDRQRTEIHYRHGHVAEAMAVRTTLPVGARLVKSERLHQDVNVRLVIGKDLVERQVAWLGNEGMTSDVDESMASGQILARQGLDLAPYAHKVARADLDDGWRYL